MIRLLLLLVALTLNVSADVTAQPRTVIVFGDSITAGSALPQADKERAWIKRIEADSAGTLILINEGKGGRPTNSVMEFEAMLQRHPKADAVVIALGMNDSRDITAACVPKAVAHVRSMIEKARLAYGQKLPVLLLGPTNINQAALGPTKPIGNEREAKLVELGEAFAHLAKDMQSQYLSLFGSVPDGCLLKDGVHPDAEGNAALAKMLGPKLQTWLAETGR